jgi:ABC-type sulfate transport system substrate-binding protein
MKLICGLILMILLAAGASAKTEEISSGPYNVSFDLNTTMKYSVLSQWDEANATSSTNIKFTNNTHALIFVTNKTVWECADLSPDLKYLNLALNYEKAIGQIVDGALFERTIDGKPGLVVIETYEKEGNILNSTIAKYWLDSKEIENYNISVAMTKVEILAKFPMNLSESLLNTIQVRMV